MFKNVKLDDMQLENGLISTFYSSQKLKQFIYFMIKLCIYLI